MATIKISENEIFEISLKKFKRLCDKLNIISEIRKREFYEKPSEKKKNKIFFKKKYNIKKNNFI
ncbi:30S ribosomal protein S21 [Candidatus Nardonella dryophthoridicola]|uniref:Small ribosomal subunit protein bS21 n=1 Tax=endosymbiont of Metamasius hemipterus TaxID=204627 RepID=A0ABT0TXH0_9GAMM|nr:30S ribosomal protein S21 [Candidatus Nardonella dryophthoridicola]MCM0158277.1 30S ribosomal protein S21 [endosymbiont of Metamasius hemipterus]